MNSIKIYIIDDHKLFVEGISSLLSDETGFELLGYSLCAKDFLKNADKFDADVYLIDINMPKMSGIELTKILKERDPDINILALTMYEDYQYVAKMIRSGAMGYILKTSSLHELTRAITQVANKKKYMGNEVQEVVFNEIGSFEKINSEITEEGNLLSPREIEILTLISKDYTKGQIAEELHISERTVETHRKNIFSKTGVNSIVGLIRYAVRNDIVSLE